jgi:hypothetical protein
MADRETLRINLDDAVENCLEHDWTEDQVRQEVEYVINTYEGARF